MLKKFIWGCAALCAILPTIGCLPLNRYDSDPNTRMTQLLNDSENLRQVRDEKSRFWMTNQPSTLTYYRLNGAIGP